MSKQLEKWMEDLGIDIGTVFLKNSKDNFIGKG